MYKKGLQISTTELSFNFWIYFLTSSLSCDLLPFYFLSMQGSSRCFILGCAPVQMPMSLDWVHWCPRELWKVDHLTREFPANSAAFTVLKTRQHSRLFISCAQLLLLLCMSRNICVLVVFSIFSVIEVCPIHLYTHEKFPQQLLSRLIARATPILGTQRHLRRSKHFSFLTIYHLSLLSPIVRHLKVKLSNMTGALIRLCQ